MLKAILPAALVLLGATAVASAHITLETQEAKAGGAYKAIFRVPHGCDGAATIKLTVKVPEGYFAVKPMPHAGWTIDTKTGKYAKAYDNFGTKLTEGVVEVSWSGGNLPDAYYDEFVMRGTLAADLPAGPLYFPVVQECEGGKVDRWIEIPEEGKPEPETPAPGVKIIAKQ
jgi:uncharacterized protein YcnI